jgi:hypothetical protein
MSLFEDSFKNESLCIMSWYWSVSFFSAPPSPELVKRVRELYHRNSSDVRFLIPVLHGLQKVGGTQHVCEVSHYLHVHTCMKSDGSKRFHVLYTQQEVISALPSFIKLSPNLVKGVFDKLLISFKGKNIIKAHAHVNCLFPRPITCFSMVQMLGRCLGKRLHNIV